MPQMSPQSFLLAVLKRRFWTSLGVFGSVVVSACMVTLVIPPEYETDSRLILDDRKSSISDLGRDLTELSEVGGSVDPIATQAELIVSQRVLELTQEALIAMDRADAVQAFPPQTIRKNLEVIILPATNIIELTLTGSDPEMTTTVLNTLAAAVVEENSETIRSQAASVRAFLEQRVPQVRERLEVLEQSEQSYRQQTGLVSLPEQTESLINNLSELQNEDRLLAAQLEATSSRIRSLQEVTDVNSLEAAYAAVRTGQDENLQRLRAQLTELEIQNIESRSRLGDQHPDLLALQDQLSDTRQRYRAQLAQRLPAQAASDGAIASDELSQRLISDLILSEVEFAALNERLDILRNEQDQVQSVLAELPQKQQTIARLARQQEEATASLQLLQGKLDEARIAEAQLVSLVRVIDQAEKPSSPSWPKLPVILVLAIASGLMLAVATIVLLELFDDKVQDLDDIKAVTDLPLLGTTPQLATPSLSPDAVPYLLQNQRCVEAYRRVIKNIEFATGKQSNCIVISSVQTGAHESAVAACLAIVAASLSRQTLLIDANLRQPVQHQMLSLPVTQGTADVVTQDLRLTEATQSTKVTNLMVLTAGTVAANPSALVESPAMKGLMQEASAQFDWVIIDAPSVGEWSDALTLGQYSDGIALVISPKVTSRTRIRAVSADLKASNANLLGTIVSSGKLKFDRPDRPDAMLPPHHTHTPYAPPQPAVNPLININRQHSDCLSTIAPCHKRDINASGMASPTRLFKIRYEPAHPPIHPSTFPHSHFPTWLSKRSLTAAIATALLAIPLTGLPTQAQSSSPPLTLPLPLPTAGDRDVNRLKPGDEVQLTVLGFPDLSGPQTILADGTLQIPLVGSLAVEGLTPSQVVEKLTVALGPYVRRPQVGLTLLNIRPLQISVTGEVRRPGAHILTVPDSEDGDDDSTPDELQTLSYALIAAGGVTPDADLRNIIVRRQLSPSEADLLGDRDHYKEIRVDLWSLIQEGDLASDVRIYHDDEIVVPTASLVTTEQEQLLSSTLAPVSVSVQVAGEVLRPGQLNLAANADVSTAVIAAGGFTEDANEEQIALLRMSSEGRLEQQAFTFGETSTPLREGDVIVVDAKAQRDVRTVFELFGTLLNPLSTLLNLLGD